MKLQHSCSAWVEEWLAAGTWAPATVRSYRLELRRWLAYMEAKGAPAALTENDVASFLDHLSSNDEKVLRALGVRAPLKASSLAQARRILGCFLLWLATQERITVSIVLAIRRWRPAAHPVAQGDAEVRSETRIRPARRSVDNPRARLAQGLAGWFGATPKELSQLRCSDIRMRRGVLEVQLPVNAGKVWRVGPSYLTSDWKQVKKATSKATHVFVDRYSLTPLSAGHIGRLIARACAPLIASPMGSARAQKRGVMELLTTGGITHAELLYHFRRTRLPSVSEQIRKGRGLAHSFDKMVAKRIA